MWESRLQIILFDMGFDQEFIEKVIEKLKKSGIYISPGHIVAVKVFEDGDIEIYLSGGWVVTPSLISKDKMKVVHGVRCGD